MAESTHYLEKHHLLCCLRRYLQSKLSHIFQTKIQTALSYHNKRVIVENYYGRDAK